MSQEAGMGSSLNSCKITSSSRFQIFATSSLLPVMLSTSNMSWSLEAYRNRFLLASKRSVSKISFRSSCSRQQLKVLLKKTILLNMVDTGGQPAFIEMLPMLTIGPALYLIFLRLDQELKQRYRIQYVSEDNVEVSLGESSYTLQEVIFQVLSSIACFRSDTSSATGLPEKQQMTSHHSQAAMLVGTYKEVKSKIKQIDGADYIYEYCEKLW